MDFSCTNRPGLFITRSISSLSSSIELNLWQSLLAPPFQSSLPPLSVAGHSKGRGDWLLASMDDRRRALRAGDGCWELLSLQAHGDWRHDGDKILAIIFQNLRGLRFLIYLNGNFIPTSNRKFREPRGHAPSSATVFESSLSVLVSSAHIYKAEYF